MHRFNLRAVAPLGVATILLALGGGIAAAQTSVPQSDVTFATQAAAANMGEIAEAKLALQKSKNSGVDKFAHRMVRDHGKAGAELKQIAAGENIKLPSEPTANIQLQLKQLGQQQGAGFDRAYIQDQVAAHHQAIDLFQTEAQNGQDAKLKSFAQKTLPVLQSHLKMADQLASNGPR